jgi:hypothetical protein
MKKVYQKLRDEQKERGVIFSSELIGDIDAVEHEVFKDDENKELIIKRLLDDKFFSASPYKYNLIRR